MKMGFLTSGVFWGIVLVLLGLSMILKVVLHIELPIFRLVLAGILVYLGIRLAMGARWESGPHRDAVIFGEGALGSAPGGEYSVVFGRGTLDLQERPADPTEKPLELVTVFGSSRVLLDRAVPTRVRLSAAFAEATAPDGNSISFGNYTWASPDWAEGKPGREIRATVVFGELKVEFP